MIYFLYGKYHAVTVIHCSQNYSASLAALQTSNEDLENKVSKLCSTTSGLNRDLLKLRRHVDSFHHECLSTWQADVLTRLIEVVYLKQRRKLPWGVVVGEHEAQGWDVVSRAYVTAANRISRKVLEQKLGLGAKYHEALKKYSEVSRLRYTSFSPILFVSFFFSPSILNMASAEECLDCRVSQLKSLSKREALRPVPGIGERE